jgi:hypothetical protein
MRKHLIKANPKLCAVIFGVLILVGLVLCSILVYRWRDSVRSEAQYKVAPSCASPEQRGCHRAIESIVKDTHDSSGRNKTTHYVSLLMPSSDLNGEIPIWWDTDRSLYSLLKPGDRVLAEEWEGQIVAIRGANNSVLRTEYDPTYKRGGLVTSLIIVPLMTIFIISIEYRLIRSIRKESLH